jgi:hypothetical protein
MPNSPGSNGVFWYSYDSATVHTTVVSSEHDLSLRSQQYQWLQSDLASVNRSLTPWVVVEVHRPLYMNQADFDQNSVGIGLRMAFEDLLKEFEVDLVLAGHYHSYFRSCAGLFRSQCDNGGPTHITIGTAGAHFDNTRLYETHWSAKNIMGEYGYGRITAANASALHFEFVQAGADDDDNAGTILDDLWLTKR